MPLIKSGSKAAISTNIQEMSKTHPRDQAIAAALSTARKYAKRAAGGAISQTPWFERNEARNIGKLPALSNTVGQNKITPPSVTSNLASLTPLGKALGSSKVSVPKTSFPKLPNAPKLPKVKMKSGGEVESKNKLLSQGPLLGSTPGRADKINAKVEDGSYVLPADCVSACGQGSSLAGHAAIERMLSTLPQVKAANKVHTTQQSNKPVPVALSDGEHLLSKESVERVGGGDYEKGRRILDHFVTAVRHRNIESLKTLPGPAQD